LIGSAATDSAGADVWSARQEISSAGKGSAEFAIAKFGILPAQITEAVETIANLSRVGLRWKVVMQASGLGWLRMRGAGAQLAAGLRGLREWLESRGGSLVVAHLGATMENFDAWGDAGDTLPLMRAVKAQFDPKCTLNPGRFVGGI
jgi:glycolate oxidase FAD binding subunit